MFWKCSFVGNEIYSFIQNNKLILRIFEECYKEVYRFILHNRCFAYQLENQFRKLLSQNHLQFSHKHTAWHKWMHKCWLQMEIIQISRFLESILYTRWGYHASFKASTIIFIANLWSHCQHVPTEKLINQNMNSWGSAIQNCSGRLAVNRCLNTMK